jgi:N-acetylneuraminic acid mutarotase
MFDNRFAFEFTDFLVLKLIFSPYPMKEYLQLASTNRLLTTSWLRQATCIVSMLTATGAYAQNSVSSTQQVANLRTPGSAQTSKVSAARVTRTLSATNTPVPQATSISSWTGAAALSQARAQHAAVATATNIYVWGGYNDVSASSLLSSLEIYEAATNTWRSGADLPLTVRGQASAAGLDGRVYSFGGAAPTITNNSYRYVPATNTWTAIASMPTGQWEAGAATGNDGRIYVFGGLYSGPSDFINSNATQIYTPTTNTWTMGTPMPTARHGEVAIKDASGLLHVIGGNNSLGSTSLTTHEVYNPTTNTWTTAAPLPMSLNQAGGTLGADGNLYVIGGKQSYINNAAPFYNTVYVYSPSTNTWSQDTNLPMVLGETKAVTVGGSIYTLAGTNGAPQKVVYRTDLLCQAPVLTLPADLTVAATTNQCSASVPFTASATNQAMLTYTIGGNPITSPYTFPVGTTKVTVTATNNCGTATGSFAVTVQDKQAPTILAAGLQAGLINGTRTLEAADIDYGSFDNCGTIASMSISPRTFTCANIGPNQVTLTVTDNAGNSASQTVTVVIVDNTAPIILAAGLEISLINGTRTIEAADIDYGSYDECGSITSMTLDRTTFTCANVGPNQVTLTVTDNSGNSTSQTVTVLITADATCPTAIRVAQSPNTLEAYPNPAHAQATLRFVAQQTGAAQLQVYNTLGERVATLYDGVAEQGQVYERTLKGTALPAGLYTCRFTQLGKTVTQRLVLVN